MTYQIDDARPRREGFISALGLTQAEFLRVLPAGVMVAALAVFGGSVAVRRLHLEGIAAGLFLVVSAVVGFIAGILAVRTFAVGAAQTVAGAVLPSGATTPSRADYSREDALLMQRDVAGALESFEAKIAADPRLADARLRAGDLYAAEGRDPARAAALFREVQRIPAVSQRDDVYASNRLVDLYDGPLGDTGRAIVELRRLMDRHAGTRAAEEAARGLATLKARHIAGQQGEA